MESRTRILTAARRPLGGERGATIVFVAMAMTALMSAVALAIDIGMLLTARTEAQRTADGAALAGAGELIGDPNDEDGARAKAIDTGNQNNILGDPVVILPEDVVIDLEAMRVEVTVRRTAARGNPIPTWFARVFGTDLVDVTARAVAQALPGNAASCLKPWTVPDGWYDANYNQYYDSDGIEYYDANTYGYGTVSGSNFRNGDPSGPWYLNEGIDAPGTTYNQDRGRPMRLKDGDPNESMESGWYFPWDIPTSDGSPSTGGDKYRWNIANCNTALISLGQEYMVENGNMIGPTKQGVEELIALDPNATWDLANETVTNSWYDPAEASPRVVYMPLFDPTYPVEPGKKPIVFTNMTAFFIVGMQGSDVIGRFMELTGMGGPGGETSEQILYPALVE